MRVASAPCLTSRSRSSEEHTHVRSARKIALCSKARIRSVNFAIARITSESSSPSASCATRSDSTLCMSIISVFVDCRATARRLMRCNDSRMITSGRKSEHSALNCSMASGEKINSKSEFFHPQIWRISTPGGGTSGCGRTVEANKTGPSSLAALALCQVRKSAPEMGGNAGQTVAKSVFIGRDRGAQYRASGMWSLLLLQIIIVDYRSSTLNQHGERDMPSRKAFRNVRLIGGCAHQGHGFLY